MTALTFTAHVLHIDGPFDDVWTIGEEISAAQFDAYQHEGDIYVLQFYEKGELQTRLVPKWGWDKMRLEIFGQGD